MSVTKTRIHDLAVEFGISSERLLAMLKEMDIFVRSHLSALDGDQVALVRARWEREKRRAAEPAGAGRRRRVTKKAAEPAPPSEPRSRRRRRTATEVAEAEAKAAQEREESERRAAEQRLILEAPLKVKPAGPSLEERAAALFREVPAVTPEPAEVEAEAPPAEPSALPEPALPGAVVGAVAAEPPRTPRPAAPTPVRPRPVASAIPGLKEPPRPVASAVPGVVTPEERRREKGVKKRKKGRRAQVDQEAVAENISRTLASLKAPTAKRGPRRREEGPSFRDLQERERLEEKEREKTLVRVTEFITVSELAGILKVPATQIVTFAFKELGQMVTVNQRLDFDLIELIASAFGFQAVQEEEYVAGLEGEAEPDRPEDLRPRPPVVTVMGHVDHGKTSLLDYIRKTNVVAGESGGITQHIGAHHVTLTDGRAITFLDTPGHEAFTAMRARGAQVTDLVVLVVAADDSVMPQTIEAVAHAKSAGVPLVVAINKVDLPSANPSRVKQELLSHGVVLEQFGGQTLSTEVSAKTGKGVDHLLEQILLQGELLELRGNPDRHAQGAVIEGLLDPGKGPIATILVQNGTLRVGDDFICGAHAGRVRALFDERGRPVREAGPALPVQVLGFEGVPQAGDSFRVVAEAAAAREIAQRRQRLEREAQHRRTTRVQSLEEFMTERREGEGTALRLIIKADQGGPAEALADALTQLSNPEVQVEIVHRGVGAVNESDVLLAKASGAIVIGFHVRPDSNARAAAEREHVEIRTYRVIYEAVDEIKAALEGLLKPEVKETVLGEAEVRQLFKISGVGTVAGCLVRQGTIARSAQVRVLRDGVVVHDGALASLKRFKDDVREVREGLECGMGIEHFNDVKVGDVIEAYKVERIARSLDEAGTVRGA